MSLQQAPPARHQLLFSMSVLFAISLSQKVGVDKLTSCFLHHPEILAKIMLQNIHSTATSLIVAAPKQSAKIGRDHVVAVTYQKPNAVYHGLNVVDARLKD